MAKTKRLVHGVGINDVDYCVSIRIESPKVNGKRRQKKVWVCPFYSVWSDLIRRCYSKSFQEKHLTYKDCSVCPEWLVFSNFRKWMIEQPWEGNQLDKDILLPGNKVYSPETCVFVSNLTNSFILDNAKFRGEYPIGVSWHKKDLKFRASCKQLGGGFKHLGNFGTCDEAHQAWLNEKRRLVKVLASQQTDIRVAEALINRYSNYKEELN